jgi:hypothetical protein
LLTCVSVLRFGALKWRDLGHHLGIRTCGFTSHGSLPRTFCGAFNGSAVRSSRYVQNRCLRVHQPRSPSSGCLKAPRAASLDERGRPQRLEFSAQTGTLGAPSWDSNGSSNPTADGRGIRGAASARVQADPSVTTSGSEPNVRPLGERIRVAVAQPSGRPSAGPMRSGADSQPIRLFQQLDKPQRAACTFIRQLALVNLASKTRL